MNLPVSLLKLAAPAIISTVCVVALPGWAAGSADTLAGANAAFAFDLFTQIAGSQSGNVFISPYSVSSVLQVVDCGAAGETKGEMEQVLHVSDLTNVPAACKGLDDAITAGQGGVTLDLANSIWYQQGTGLKPKFSAECATFFRAKTDALDFSNPESARVINDWASASTRGRIKDVIQPPIDARTRVILANAIYFKGRWAREFDKNLTKDRAFTRLDGSQKQTPMMHQQGHFKYYETTGLQAACLPYVGGRLQIYLFLPATGASLKQMLDGFNDRTWQKGLWTRFLDRPGNIVLPRFKLDYSVVLNESLQALGMVRAFSPAADFSAISGGKLFLSEVKQKSFVDVNEEGTEAAAVTTVSMHAMAVLRPQAPFEMILDHPFAFVIGDQTTQTVLFMGIVADPSP